MRAHHNIPWRKMSSPPSIQEEGKKSQNNKSKHNSKSASTKMLGRKRFWECFYWKSGAGFLLEPIKCLDCQMKMEHKNSLCSQKRFDSRLPSSSLTFMKCLFYLAWKHLQHQSYESGCCGEGHFLGRSLRGEREKTLGGFVFFFFCLFFRKME